MFNWRQTSPGLHRSVHTASTAWTFSGALWGGVGIRFFRSLFSVTVLVEVISKFLFLVIVLITDTEFKFTLLGAKHDGLAVHASHHVERRLRFTPQRQLQKIFLDASLDGLAEFRLDLKIAIRRTQAFDALIRPLVVVMFDPELDPFAGRLEAVELRPDQEVLPEGGPEAFHLAQRHRMLRPRLEVLHAIFLQHRFEAASATPRSILPPIVSQHLLRRLELADGDAIHLDHRRRRGTAEQVCAHDEPRVIVHEGDDISVTTPQPEGEDVRLPHLIGGGSFKEARANHVALLGGLTFGHQVGCVQPLAHGLGARR